ncbi:MAG: M20 metallopeptidase family protein [Thermoplasmataceae archaeon]
MRLIFQPAEESPPGGAVKLIEHGVLTDVKYIIGQHVLSTLPAGTIGINYGLGAAITDDFYVSFTGAGGHGSRPNETSDVLIAASVYTLLCQTVISRLIDQTKPAVLTFGTFHSGDRENIISSKSELSGTVRTYDETVRDTIKEEMHTLHEQVKTIYKCGGTFEYKFGYPALLNNPDVAHLVESTAVELLGKEKVINVDPSMGGEDFAYYLRQIPGCFYRLGVGNKEKAITAAQHSKTYRIDEAALVVGSEVMFRSALRLFTFNP